MAADAAVVDLADTGWLFCMEEHALIDEGHSVGTAVGCWIEPVGVHC